MRKREWIALALIFVCYLFTLIINSHNFPYLDQPNGTKIFASILCVGIWALSLFIGRKGSNKILYMTSFLFWGCVFITTVILTGYVFFDSVESVGIYICMFIFEIPFYGLAFLPIPVYYGILNLLSAGFLIFSFIRIRNDRKKALFYLLSVLLMIGASFRTGNETGREIAYNIFITLCFLGWWSAFFFIINNHSKLVYMLALAYWSITIICAMFSGIYSETIFLVPLIFSPLSTFLSIKLGTVFLCLISIGAIVLTVCRLKGKMEKKEIQLPNS